MHDDQFRIDADMVRELVSDQFPEYRDEPIVRLDTAGTVNAIFRVGSAVTARFPLRAVEPIEHAEELRCEAAAMVEFANCSPVETPRPIGLGQPQSAYPLPWSMQTWVEGVVATSDGLATSEVFANDLATLIASLRIADTHGRQFNRQGRGVNLPDHDDWMATCFEKSAGLLNVPKLRRYWFRLRELPRGAPDVMNHGDLIPPNLLLRGEHLVGVLDGGGFGPADPALDLVACWHLLDHNRRGTVRVRLGSSDVEWKRGAGWAFQQAMGLVWYYRDTNPTMSELGRSTLNRILGDPEL